MDCNEVWKDIEGYEGAYQVSNIGRVRRSAHEVTFSDGRVAHYREKVLKQNFVNGGYLRVGLELCSDGKYIRKQFLVHRLVASAFVPNPECKKEVNHIDGNKTNNNAGNLEWVTRSENLSHSWKTGLRSSSDAQVASAIENLKKAQIASVKANSKRIGCSNGETYASAAEAQRELGIWDTNIRSCCKGKVKTAGGFTFWYVPRSS